MACSAETGAAQGKEAAGVHARTKLDVCSSQVCVSKGVDSWKAKHTATPNQHELERAALGGDNRVPQHEAGEGMAGEEGC